MARCIYCGKNFDGRGLPAHEQYCRRHVDSTVTYYTGRAFAPVKVFFGMLVTVFVLCAILGAVSSSISVW